MADKTLSDKLLLFLIRQYYEKPKAQAHIKMLLSELQAFQRLQTEFATVLDIDNARGKVLDLIGRIVGISRQVNKGLAKRYLGFSLNPKSLNFASLSNPLRSGGAFYSVGDSAYTSLSLNDDQYRKFIKLKIAKNSTSPYF